MQALPRRADQLRRGDDRVGFADQPCLAHQPELADARVDGEESDQAPGNVRDDRRFRQHDDRPRRCSSARAEPVADASGGRSAARVAGRVPCRHHDGDVLLPSSAWILPPHPSSTLARELIARRSLTPDDAGCQTLLAQRLAPLGFRCETLQSNGVTNLWARRGDTRAARLLRRSHRRRADGPARCVAVPTHSSRHVRDGYLYGRGAADMKGSLAAFVIAIERFVAQHPRPPGSIALLITSDEEGPSIDGTVKVVERLAARGERHRLLRRRRAVVGRRARRHDQERPPRHAVGDADRQGRAGAHRLSAPRATIRSISSRPVLAELARDCAGTTATRIFRRRRGSARTSTPAPARPT